MTITDPFAPPAEGQGDFTTLDDLGVKANLDGTAVGRLVLIMPKSIQTNIQGKPDSTGRVGKPYSAVFCELVVLDGPVGEKVTSVPMSFADYRIHQSYIVNDVKGRFVATAPTPAGRDSEFVLTPKDPNALMLLGRLVKIKNKSGGFSWSISDKGFSAEEASLARAYIAAHPVVPADPFA